MNKRQRPHPVGLLEAETKRVNIQINNITPTSGKL
jgi:hypothetical protein